LAGVVNNVSALLGGIIMQVLQLLKKIFLAILTVFAGIGMLVTSIILYGAAGRAIWELLKLGFGN